VGHLLMGPEEEEEEEEEEECWASLPAGVI
jgi:hypothetical protein